MSIFNLVRKFDTDRKVAESREEEIRRTMRRSPMATGLSGEALMIGIVQAISLNRKLNAPMRHCSIGAVRLKANGKRYPLTTPISISST